MAVVRYNVFDISQRRLMALLTSTALFALGIWLLNDVLPYRNVWDRFYTENRMGTFFCEKTDMSKVVRQPINTFSNFIYLISAIAILRRGWKDQSKGNKYNLVCANPFYSIMLGVILICIFCASVFFHSSLIHFAGELDFSAVYSLSLFPLMYFSHRLWLLSIDVPSNQYHRFSTRTVTLLFTLTYLGLTFFLPQGIRNYVVLGIIIFLIVFAFIVERKDRGKTNHYYLLVCIIYILIAVMWFIFDIHKIICNPESVIQPHSLWHLFSGAAIFYFYMYIRSEKNKI